MTVTDSPELRYRPGRLHRITVAGVAAERDSASCLLGDLGDICLKAAVTCSEDVAVTHGWEVYGRLGAPCELYARHRMTSMSKLAESPV